MRILIIEANDNAARTLQSLLTPTGWDLTTVDLSTQSIVMGRLQDFDFVLTSITQFQHIDLIGSFRIIKPNLPIVVISGDDSIDNKLEAFKRGADDFVARPFHVEELIARIHAIYKRYARTTQPLVHSVHPYVIKITCDRVTVNDKDVHLTKKEMQVLSILAENHGRVVSKAQIMMDLYHSEAKSPVIKILDVFVCKLRKKLSDATNGGNYIRTDMGGNGYYLTDKPFEPDPKIIKTRYSE